jgi:hypothetical protein
MLPVDREVAEKLTVHFTDDMLPYDETRVCPKCLFDGVGTQYRPQSKYVIPNGKALEVALPEHMLRTCGRCRYEWLEMARGPRKAPDATP